MEKLFKNCRFLCVKIWKPAIAGQKIGLCLFGTARSARRTSASRGRKCGGCGKIRGKFWLKIMDFPSGAVSMKRLERSLLKTASCLPNFLNFVGRGGRGVWGEFRPALSRPLLFI